jgi:protein TonB
VFDTLLASNLDSGPWARPAAAATLLHLGLLLCAVTATGTSPKMSAVVRDTIRLEIGRLPSRPSLPQAVPNPHSIFPAPPQPPDIELEPLRLDLPRLNLNIPLKPGVLSGVASAQDSSGPPFSELGRPDFVFAVKDVDQPPELVNDLHPQYPDALRQSRVSGAVQLEYLISIDGLVDPRSIRVLQSTHPAFTASATEAVRSARFTPARRGGQPVAVLVQQTIRFLNR